MYWLGRYIVHREVHMYDIWLQWPIYLHGSLSITWPGQCVHIAQTNNLVQLVVCIESYFATKSFVGVNLVLTNNPWSFKPHSLFCLIYIITLIGNKRIWINWNGSLNIKTRLYARISKYAILRAFSVLTILRNKWTWKIVSTSEETANMEYICVRNWRRKNHALYISGSE